MRSRQQSTVPIPSPNGSIITHANQHVAIPGEGRLPDGCRALRMHKCTAFGLPRVGHVHFPHKSRSILVAQRHDFVAEIQSEANEPDFALLVVKTMNYRCGRSVSASFHPGYVLEVIHLAWLPANNGILAGLGQDKVTHPLNTVYIVAVDISSREVWKMLLHRIERSTAFIRVE